MEESIASEENSKEKEVLRSTTALVEKCLVSSEPSTLTSQRIPAKGTKRKISMNDDKVSCSQRASQGSEKVRIRKKIPIPPLPSQMPPVNLLHRDIVRAWGRELKISTKGQKLDIYKRICEYAYPNQKDIPDNAKEARILTESKRRSMMGMAKIALEGSEGTSEVAIPGAEMVPVLEGPETVVVTTSASDSVFASWARIAAMAGKTEEVEAQSTQESCDVRWCVVHGRTLPANAEGWVRLQFHAGQAWVPERKGQVCALFLLPSCNFPPASMEDNMLCPKCVQRNKALMKSLQ